MEYESIHRETHAREFFIASSRDEEMVEYESSITLAQVTSPPKFGANYLRLKAGRSYL